MTGKDKGRRGQVLKVFSSSKILVENINLVKKHQKGNPNTGQEERERSRAARIAEPGARDGGTQSCMLIGGV